jgi:hypothetical protein
MFAPLCAIFRFYIYLHFIESRRPLSPTGAMAKSPSKSPSKSPAADAGAKGKSVPSSGGKATKSEERGAGAPTKRSPAKGASPLPLHAVKTDGSKRRAKPPATAEQMAKVRERKFQKAIAADPEGASPSLLPALVAPGRAHLLLSSASPIPVWLCPPVSHLLRLCAPKTRLLLCASSHARILTQLAQPAALLLTNLSTTAHLLSPASVFQAGAREEGARGGARGAAAEAARRRGARAAPLLQRLAAPRGRGAGRRHREHLLFGHLRGAAGDRARLPPLVAVRKAEGRPARRGVVPRRVRSRAHQHQIRADARAGRHSFVWAR